MKSDRRLLGAALGFALFVSACSGAASSPAASSAASAAASSAPSVAASVAASEPAASEAAPSEAASQDNGGSTSSDNPAAASDLEKLIPDKVGSVAMQKSSVDYSQLGMSGLAFNSAEIDPYLKEKGKSITDLSLALGIGDGGKPMMYVFRLKGVPATDFGPKFFKTELNGMDKKNIGGKDVYWTGAAGFTTMVYMHDDILVYVLLASEDEAAQIMQQMP